MNDPAAAPPLESGSTIDRTREQRRPSYQVAEALRPPRSVSAACLATAALSFLAAWVMIVAAAPDVVQYFYQPRVLAIVHTLTLGWISLTMIGILYQFVPALTKHPIPWRAGAAVQATAFALGSAGMIASFWLGRLDTAAWNATVVALSTLLFAALLLPGLARAPRRDATVVGIACAVVYFAVTALLGSLYAWDKVVPFLGGSVLSNIAGHAHLGLLGWITLTICAVSYRVVAAFLLPTELVHASAKAQIVVLVALVPILVTVLLLRAAWLPLVAAAGAANLIWYAANLVYLARTRRMPIDWALRHVVAALCHLCAAMVCGGLLLLAGADTEWGSRLATVYGLLLLVGWISNYIVGIGSRMAPGVMGLGAAPIVSGGRAALVFILLNTGLLAVAASLSMGSATALRMSALAPLAAVFLFIGSAARRVTLAKIVPPGVAARRSPGS